MKSLIWIGSVSTIACGHTISANQQWTNFKQKFNKIYQSKHEENERFQIFQENLHNYAAKNVDSPLSFGVTQFSDMTEQEWFGKYTMPAQPYPEDGEQFECPEKFNGDLDEQAIPEGFEDEFDWRDPAKNHLGLVADRGVKNQNQCGSCYAFSSTAAMEGNMCMKGLADCTNWQGLSEQQVLDCGSYRDGEEMRPWYSFGGCWGGWQANVFQYAYRTGGMSEAAEYPYQSGNGTFIDENMEIGPCRVDEKTIVATPDKDICGTVNKNGVADVEVMKKALVHKGTLAVSMWVNGSFHGLTGGFYTKEQGQEDCKEDHTINHCVAIVGWTTETFEGETEPRQFWIMKNSWDTTWADGGYIKYEMGYNICGIEGNVQWANMDDGAPDFVEPTLPPAKPTDMPTDAPTTVGSGSMNVLSLATLVIAVVMY